MPASRAADALLRLDELTRRLRAECPWDREQDERSIVPHTVEEAYELADAAHSGDDAKLRDELGDVLFQVHFLALLMSERGAGDLADVAEHCTQKLIRRHPHVFSPGETSALTAGDVLRNWDAIKRREPGRGDGIFNDVPENLPALTHARKLQRRAKSDGASLAGPQADLALARDGLAELELALARRAERSAGARDRPSAGESSDPEAFQALGDALFALVGLARELALDPELALRAASGRFRDAVLASSGAG